MGVDVEPGLLEPLFSLFTAWLGLFFEQVCEKVDDPSWPPLSKTSDSDSWSDTEISLLFVEMISTVNKSYLNLKLIDNYVEREGAKPLYSGVWH